MGDHGQGFAGTGFDYLHKDVLDPAELKEALAQTPAKPDIVVMDVRMVLMSMATSAT